MECLPLSAKLDDVKRNINRWNKRDEIGLVEIKDLTTPERVVWEAGNCAIQADKVDEEASELTLLPVKDIPPDYSTVDIWNRVGELCEQVDWTTKFEPVQKGFAWVVHKLTNDMIADTPLEEAEEWGWKKKDIESAREIRGKEALPTRDVTRRYIASFDPDTSEAGKMKQMDVPDTPIIDVVILTVLPEEYKAVHDKLTDLRVPPPSSGVNLYAWVLGQVPRQQSGRSYSVALGMMGRAGTDMSSLATIDAITCWKPRYIIFVGIAGGFDRNNMQLGDVVVADLIYGYEYGKLEQIFLPRSNWVYRTDLALVNGATAFYTTNPQWVNDVQAEHPANRTPQVFTGQVASGDKVVDDPTNEFFAQVRKAWPKLQAVEMEGAGAAVAIEHTQSKGLPIGFLMIRGISDMPMSPDIEKETRGTQERDSWKPYAAQVAAAFTVSFIAHGLPLPPSQSTMSTRAHTPTLVTEATDSLPGTAAASISATRTSSQSPRTPAISLPSDPAPLESTSTSGSPFIIGRPLRANEPIFGRKSAFRFIAGELAKFSSVNVVGERRMGKTSLLNHLIGHQDELFYSEPNQPPLILARIDLQAGVTNAARFYGIALRELLNRLPPSRSAEARAFREQRERLHETPELGYAEFERALKRLRDPGGVCARPALIVDEFQHLLDPGMADGFPYPYFFDGMRAMITAELLAMVVASRRPLVEYFYDPARPNSLTSTFPSYFTPFTLAPLDDEAADTLLLQPSDHPLTVREAAQARRWASGHPCHLQAAGHACYEAQVSAQGARWARARFAELKGQSCMTGLAPTRPFPPGRGRLWRGLRRFLRLAFRDLPIAIGRPVQALGARIDDVAAWIIGAVVIVLVILLLFGAAKTSDVLDAIKKGLGL